MTEFTLSLEMSDEPLQDTYENRLHLRKTQINLVFHSIYTIFALRFAKRTVPDVKIERDFYET